MEFKGTKGKWVKFNSRIEQTHGYTTSVICRFEPTMSNQSRYNALLISKAPEMLEMLQSFVNDFDNGLIEDFQIPRDRFEQLIKQATTLHND